MTYYESAAGEIITRREALSVLRQHGVRDDESVTEFFADLGDMGHYPAQSVLVWLGVLI